MLFSAHIVCKWLAMCCCNTDGPSLLSNAGSKWWFTYTCAHWNYAKTGLQYSHIVATRHLAGVSYQFEHSVIFLVSSSIRLHWSGLSHFHSKVNNSLWCLLYLLPHFPNRATHKTNEINKASQYTRVKVYKFTHHLRPIK